MSLPYSDNYTLLGAVTVDTTGETFDVSKRQLKSIQFTAASIAAGNGVFTVEVSNDGTNFVAYNRLVDNLTNTNVQTDTRVGSVTLSSNTSKVYFFPAGDYFRYVRAAVNMTTDGAYTATLQAAG
jgi:hypothetical protein